MRAVLMSIKPKWCELIASGEKTVEVRKSKPKLETPFKVYIYCTIGDGASGDRLVPSGITCGKVIGEFVCDKIVQFKNSLYDDGLHETVAMSCVPMYDLLVYIEKQSFGYGWHISNLVIYDTPRDLSEFLIDCKNCGKKFVGDPNCWQGCVNGYRRLTRSPQSWCYVEKQK